MPLIGSTADASSGTSANSAIAQPAQGQGNNAWSNFFNRGADALARDYKRLMRANMADEIERFVGALNAGAITPEDF